MTVLLSICIPTFNRSDRVAALVTSILENSGDFELCVHVDGSTDDSISRLSLINDARLKISHDVNRGRASAISVAVGRAIGRFAVLYDDDDTLSHDGLSALLDDCQRDLPEHVAGYVYHMSDALGAMIGNPFPVDRANLLSLRADYGVRGDKKEMVLTAHLRAVCHLPGSHRRIPTSLFWARLSRTQDIICRHIIVGSKAYLPDGMTRNIRRLKTANTGPMIQLNKEILGAFWQGRYHSRTFAFRAAVAAFWYSLLHVRNAFRSD